MRTRLAPSPAAPHIAAQDEARTFLFALYRNASLDKGEWFELRCLDCRTTPATPGPRLYVRSITELVEKAIALRERWDVFFGVGLRRCPEQLQMARCPHDSKGLDHVSRLPAVWCDVDVQSPDEPNKRFPTVDDALEALYALDEPPRIIVGSGAGLHAYWPLDAGPSEQTNRIAMLNGFIAQQLGVDNCGDVPRILRVPGTFNHKHGRPLPVHLIEPSRVGGQDE